MNQELSKEKQGGLIAQLLAFIAGFIDATGYIVLFHMFTANMSGNSVVLGIRLGQGQWPEILIRAFRIPLFMTGVMVGALLIELSVRWGFRRIFSVIFFIEALLIGFFCLSGRAVYAAGALALDSPYFYAIAALPPVAMGLQTAALHRIGSLSIRTTFVTGMITSACKEFINYLFWFKDHYKSTRLLKLLLTSPRQVSFVRMVLTGYLRLPAR